MSKTQSQTVGESMPKGVMRDILEKVAKADALRNDGLTINYAKLEKQKKKARPSKYYKPKDTHRKPYDETMIKMIDQAKQTMQEFKDVLKPECPECKKSQVQEKGTRPSYYAGTRTVFRCLNPDCPRIEFVIDDSRINNMGVKNVVLTWLYHGGENMAPAAKKFLENYGVNYQNMPLYEELRQKTTGTR